MRFSSAYTIAAGVVLLLPLPGVAGGPLDVRIDGAFPGGNIVVEDIRGDQVSLHQDLRDTNGDWFYWHFRVRGAASRTLTFRFTKGNIIGARGPAVSLDRGETWRWLGTGAVQGSTFRYAFPADAADVRFCLAMPYLERHLNAFLKTHERNPHLKRSVLCRTRKGRTSEQLNLGRIDGPCTHRVILTCRHHACEMMASYVLEGIVDAALADGDDGAWLRRHVEFLIIPFMDKDGVEDGDQGKNRKPHDHNRDYAGESIYPSVRAMRKLTPVWSRGRLRLVIDLHCPYIRGRNNEWVYFVGTPDQANWKRLETFSKILERVRQGPLPFRSSDNIPFGRAWNTYAGPLESCSRWGTGLPGVLVASTLEVPYANARGVAVTAASARRLGHDLARTIKTYLSSSAQ